MYCPHCKKEMPDGMKFCGSCGSPLTEEPTGPQMSCPSCGRTYPAGTTFCGICGTALAEKPENGKKKKKKKKRSFGKGLAAGLLAMALLLGCVCLVFHFVSRPSQGGWKTPEAAARACFDALRSGDLDGVMEVFDPEVYEEHFNPEELYDYRGFCLTSDAGIIPADNEYSRGLCLRDRREAVESWLVSVYLAAALPDYDGNPVAFGDDSPYQTPENFLEELTIEDLDEVLSGLEVREILSLEELEEKIPGLEGIWSGYADTFSKGCDCDGLTEVVVRFDAGGRTWYQELVLISFDGKWYGLQSYGAVCFSLSVSPYTAGLLPEETFESVLDAQKEG